MASCRVAVQGFVHNHSRTEQRGPHTAVHSSFQNASLGVSHAHLVVWWAAATTPTTSRLHKALPHFLAVSVAGCRVHVLPSVVMAVGFVLVEVVVHLLFASYRKAPAVVMVCRRRRYCTRTRTHTHAHARTRTHTHTCVQICNNEPSSLTSLI